MSDLSAKPPEPRENNWVILGTALLFLVLGVAGLIFGFSLPEAKQAAARALKYLSLVCLGLGVLILLLGWIMRQVREWLE